MSNPRSVGTELHSWFDDPAVKDREGKCGGCGQPMTLSSFATACALTFNRELKRRGKPPLSAAEIARCEECYGRERMARGATSQQRPGANKPLAEWRTEWEGRR